MLNLLKEIQVTGTLFPTHGRLSIMFTFHNPTNHPLSPTYFFPLPKDASITGMQILTKEKTLVRAEIIPTSNLDLRTDGFRLMQLDTQLYSLTWECLPSGDTCTIILECLFHLLPQKGICRMVLPFGLPTDPYNTTAPCPVNLDLVLKNLTPTVLSPYDNFDPNTGIFSSTAQTGCDFVLDLSVYDSDSCGFLQEEFGKGCGFARLCFPADLLDHQTTKHNVLFLLDLSHTTSLRDGNRLKELFFRAVSSLPDGVSANYITNEGVLSSIDSRDNLYQELQSLPVGIGDTETLFHYAASHQSSDILTLLISDGAHTPSLVPDYPMVLMTAGSVRPFGLSHFLSARHLHFYPTDNPENTLPDLLGDLLSPISSVEITPEGGNIRDCLLHAPDTTLSHGYLDVAFSYSGKAPQGFTLWQNKQKNFTCPMLHISKMSRMPDGAQLYASVKVQNLTALMEKASPVSCRTIKSELAQLQTEYGILGSETALSIPCDGEETLGVPVGFHLATDNFYTSIDRPTIFGDGVRTLPKEEKMQLAARCRKTIYDSIRSNGAIRSPLGITPQMSAEETALSYLALLADGKTNDVILHDALTYLSSAPKTPWDFFVHGDRSKETLQKLLPSLPDFETLLDSAGESLPLMTACYLLLWLSLI